MKGITESKAPAPSKSPKPEKHGAGRKTEKQRLQERLAKAGVSGVDSMTTKQLQSELKRIKSEGGEVPDLRQGNSAPLSLNKDPEVKQIKQDLLMEIVDVQLHDRSTGEIKSEKKKTMVAILTSLRADALSRKNTPGERTQAAKEFFDRTLGKARQEIEVEGEIKVEEQRAPTPKEREAARKFRQIGRAHV